MLNKELEKEILELRKEVKELRVILEEIRNRGNITFRFSPVKDPTPYPMPYNPPNTIPFDPPAPWPGGPIWYGDKGTWSISGSVDPSIISPTCSIHNTQEVRFKDGQYYCIKCIRGN